MQQTFKKEDSAIDNLDATMNKINRAKNDLE